ncbi:MAG: futalosine hydrolase [Nitrospirae bacterium]|nr:futalosine hydrolase [Nitrospirota bacterium]
MQTLLNPGEITCRPVLICAVALEAGHLERELARYGIHAEVSVCGAGKANAAASAAMLIAQQKPSFVVSFGVGGAYPGSKLGIGDVAIATCEIMADEGVQTAQGFRLIEAVGVPLADGADERGANTFPADGGLRLVAEQAFTREGMKYRSGPFLTVSAVTGDDARARLLRRRFGAVCENMEGGAIAQICFRHGVPFVEIRGISNIVERRDRSRWRLAEAAEAAGRAAAVFLKSAAVRAKEK